MQQIKIILPFIFSLLIVSFNMAVAQKPNKSDRYMEAYKQYLGATCPLAADSIKHFVYFARDREAIHDHPFLKIPRFTGAQIMYAWTQLEPKKGKYDFSIIRDDYNYLLRHGKKLFIQLQDATFDARYAAAPAYLLTEEYDGGQIYQRNDDGKPEGYVVKRWNINVQKRFALLLQALGKQFDGKIEGINLQETAVGVGHQYDSSFTAAIYFQAIKTNMLAMKKAFHKSVTMQYANFMPGEWLPWEDKGMLRSIYKYGDSIGVSLGAPDLMVQTKGQLNHPIAMMHESQYKVPLGIAVQDGNYISRTNTMDVPEHRENIVPLLHAFAKDFMKVSYMFWVNQEPYFSEDVIPCFMPD